MKLSPHFDLSEFTFSRLAEFNGIRNNCPDSFLPSLKTLCGHLETARRLIGCAIIITSGYRCDKLNKLVGGKPRSYHRVGRAADLYPADGDLDNLFYVLETLPHTELIRYKNFIHYAV